MLGESLWGVVEGFRGEIGGGLREVWQTAVTFQLPPNGGGSTLKLHLLFAICLPCSVEVRRRGTMSW